MKTVVAAVVVLLAVYAVAAQTLQPYPDVITSQTAAATALVNYKAAVEANIAAVSAAQQANAAALAKLSDQAIAVQSLQDRLAADEARTVVLETTVKALQAKVAAAGTTLATP